MNLSALRLRLTLGFAVAFAVAFAILDAALVVQREREGRAALAELGAEAARGVMVFIDREQAEPETAMLPAAAREVLREWPDDGMGIVIRTPGGAPLASRPPRTAGGAVTSRFTPGDGRVEIQVTVPRSGLDADLAALRRTMWILTPLLLLLALGAGYGLARWSLAPARTLRDEIATLEGRASTARLPSAVRGDEIGAIAAAFNGLLDRIGAADMRNRAFVQEAAHQLRTPLTLVRGEAELALAPGDALPREALLAALSRIDRAARQMHRRVDELAFLAEAQSTRGVDVREPLDLSAVVRECAELMERRAADASMPLEIAAASVTIVEGDDRLLREAVLELIENACRHGEWGTPIGLRVSREGDATVVMVESSGPAFSLRDAPDDLPAGEGHHLGLAIVRWIVLAHGGSLRLTRAGTRNQVALVFSSVVAP